MDSNSRTFYLGRYNCIEQLGSGPLGETFRAKIYGVSGFEKQFAVKRLHLELSGDENFVTRFVQAASAFAALDHQRITRVHEVNAQDAHYYIVLDLVRGLDLRRLLDLLQMRGEALPADVAATIAVDVAEALEYAHGNTTVLPGGVLHLGLTAQSVMVTYEGGLKLIDVGLLTGLIRPGWSNDDALTPTLAYLAPEVWRGEEMDSGADIFSLGVLLHELTGGRRVFFSDSAAELRRAIESGPPPPPPAEPRLQKIITRALQPNRAERFATMREMREALQAVVRGRSERAHADLSALVRRLALPRERRTGAFSAISMSMSNGELLTPLASTQPPPVPHERSQTTTEAAAMTGARPWAPPASSRTTGTMSAIPRQNTLAGIGPSEITLGPEDMIELTGATTEKTGPPLHLEDAETHRIPRIGSDVGSGVALSTMTLGERAEVVGGGANDGVDASIASATADAFADVAATTEALGLAAKSGQRAGIEAAGGRAGAAFATGADRGFGSAVATEEIGARTAWDAAAAQLATGDRFPGREHADALGLSSGVASVESRSTGESVAARGSVANVAPSVDAPAAALGAAIDGPSVVANGRSHDGSSVADEQRAIDDWGDVVVDDDERGQATASEVGQNAAPAATGPIPVARIALASLLEGAGARAADMRADDATTTRFAKDSQPATEFPARAAIDSLPSSGRTAQVNGEQTARATATSDSGAAAQRTNGGSDGGASQPLDDATARRRTISPASGTDRWSVSGESELRAAAKEPSAEPATSGVAVHFDVSDHSAQVEARGESEARASSSLALVSADGQPAENRDSGALQASGGAIDGRAAGAPSLSLVPGAGGAGESSWTPPPISPPSLPSPEPVFAQPSLGRRETVEPIRSTVPGTRLPPRSAANWVAMAAIAGLALAGGTAVFLGLRGDRPPTIVLPPGATNAQQLPHGPNGPGAAASNGVHTSGAANAIGAAGSGATANGAANANGTSVNDVASANGTSANDVASGGGTSANEVASGGGASSSSGAPTANQTTANGQATANGTTANGTTANGTTANGTTANGTMTNGVSSSNGMATAKATDANGRTVANGVATAKATNASGRTIANAEVNGAATAPNRTSAGTPRSTVGGADGVATGAPSATGGTANHAIANLAARAREHAGDARNAANDSARGPVAAAPASVPSNVSKSAREASASAAPATTGDSARAAGATSNAAASAGNSQHASAQSSPAAWTPVTNTPSGASFGVTSVPAGATVFVDGEARGSTPAQLTLTPGAHKLVVAAEHHKLLTRDITANAGAALSLTLEPTKLPTTIAGPAGLKVRCRSHGELRILVDGADSGLSCPNDERISVTPGVHKIGLYSVRTGQTHEIEREIVDGDYSTRVYVKF